MKNFEIAILGSGASGVMTAIIASASGKSIALIDKNKLPAKKLMATGNGRCNLSNAVCTPSTAFYNQDIDRFLSRFPTRDTLTFFEELGLCTQTDEEGRIYPLSGSAKSVIEVLNNALAKYDNISVFGEKIIEKVEKCGENYKITCNNDVFIAKKLVIATGGNTHNLLSGLGIKVNPLMPSLCAIKTKENTKLLNGVRISPVKVTAEHGGAKYQEIGEVLFKDRGISGIAIFNASALFARNDFSGTITLDLLPNISQKDLIEKLKERRKLAVCVSKFFEGMFVGGIAYYLFEKCKIDENRRCSALTDGEIITLAKAIKNLQFSVNGYYENNQVFSGGIDLHELSTQLEHKTHKNLFFCGEVCDIDGLCGGYNLQWAWTSGYIVGKSL